MARKMKSTAYLVLRKPVHANGHPATVNEITIVDAFASTGTLAEVRNQLFGSGRASNLADQFGDGYFMVVANDMWMHGMSKASVAAIKL